jgi:DnaJ-class molecular chaperone
MSTTRDFYDILGITKTATAAEIKSAYRKLALKWHPDRNKEKDATEKFKEINEAYEVLSSPEKKSRYDQFGHAAFGGGTVNPHGGASGVLCRQLPTVEISILKIFGTRYFLTFDIFSSFFGGGARRSPTSQTSLFSETRIYEAVNGVEKTIVHQGKQYTVKIPAGIDEGNRIRYNEFDVVSKLHRAKFSSGKAMMSVNHEGLSLAILGGETEALLTRPQTQNPCGYPA